MRPKDGDVAPLEANVDKMEALLKSWASEIDALAAKARPAGGLLNIDFLLNLDELKAKRAVAQAKIDEFKAAGSGT